MKAAFAFLLKQKEKLSKGKEIQYNQLKLQNYLKSGNNLSVEQMRIIFMIRSRNLPVKRNFSKQFPDTKCVIPQCQGQDSQIHLFYCECIDNTNIISTLHTSEYSDIFSENIIKQTLSMQILMKKYEGRQKFLSPHPRQGDPE